VIHQQHRTSPSSLSGSFRIGIKISLQTHPALETNALFRLIQHWSIAPGSPLIGAGVAIADAIGSVAGRSDV
jgi:hypothetical protein